MAGSAAWRTPIGIQLVSGLLNLWTRLCTDKLAEYVLHSCLTLDTITTSEAAADTKEAPDILTCCIAVFAIVVTIVVWGCPESPRWLAKRGRYDEAVEVLCAVFDLQPDDPYVVSEMSAIRAAIALEGKDAAKITSLFKKDILQTRRRVVLAWFGLFMNQWSGKRIRSCARIE